MSDDDLLRYGPCECCGMPRTVRVTEHEDGVSLLYELYCPLCEAKVKFWDCPEDHPREPQRVRIVWDGDLATCQDCGRTNRD